MKDIRVRRSASVVSTLPTLLLVFFALTGICSARPRTDVIWFKNGDRITCEILKLEKGYLYVRIEYSEGTIPLDWSKIANEWCALAGAAIATTAMAASRCGLVKSPMRKPPRLTNEVGRFDQRLRCASSLKS